MSRQVFEYFLDPEELEPFYSELRQSLSKKRRRAVPQIAPEQTSEPAGASLVSTVCVADSDQKVEENPEPIRAKTNRDSTSDPGQPQTKPQPEIMQHPTIDSPIGNSSSQIRVRRLLSVHALGQFAFCPRSAILAVERGDDRDSEEPLPRLTYLPNFDRERIEEMLGLTITRLGFCVFYLLALGLLIKMGLVHQNRWVFYFGLVAFWGLGFWSLNLMVCILDLVLRRRAAIRAEAREPEPEITSIQSVNWWSLLKSGFEPIAHQRPFEHPELPLEGCPWRVLQRGSRRLPVIRAGSRKLGGKPGELYEKHRIRLAAYAMLLESARHTDVPYGLVFPADSPHGLALPITDLLRKQAVRMLQEFEQKLVDSQQHQIEPNLPAQRNRCKNCDYGKPIPTTAREVSQARQAGLRLVVLQHRSGKLYRCDCGDRFGSAPTHGSTVRKGLTAIVN